MTHDACPPEAVCICRDRANNDRLRDVLEALDGEVTARPETPAQVWAETMRTVSGLRLNAQMALDAADDAIRHRNEDNERWFAECADRDVRIATLEGALRYYAQKDPVNGDIWNTEDVLLDGGNIARAALQGEAPSAGRAREQEEAS